MSGYPATIQTNLTVTSRQATTLTADASPGTEGAWTQLIASTDAESQWGMGYVRNVGASGVDTGMLLDIGTGAAASETAIINNLNVGQAMTTLAASHGKIFCIPQVIAASARVSARIEAVVASDTALAAIFLFQGVRHIEDVGAAVTYGADETAGEACGTAVVAGNGAYGSWTEIGTTSENHNLWMVGLDISGTTGSNDDYLVQIGHGPDTANVTVIGGPVNFAARNDETLAGPFPPVPMYASTSSGTKVFARIASGGTSTFGVIIYGMSGTEVSGGSTVAINRDNDMDIRQAGSTDQSVLIHMVKTADGTAHTAIAHTDITQLHYVRQNAAPVSFAAANLAAIDSAHSDGGWEQYEATDAPGDYRLDLPDAALASGVPRVKIVVQTATSRGELTIDLTADNPRAAATTATDIASQVVTTSATTPVKVDITHALGNALGEDGAGNNNIGYA